MTVFCLTHNI